MPRDKSVNQSHNSDAIVHAALRLAAEKGWGQVTAAQIARAAKVKMAEFYAIARDKNDIVRLIDDWLDGQIGQGTITDGTPHDRLFEVLMNRFDGMQEYRAGLSSIMREVMKCPEFWAAHAKRCVGRIRHMLSQAGVETNPGPVAALDITGLGIVYALAMRVWVSDDSEDMAKTMAEIDKRLGQIERLRGYIRI